MSCQEKDSDVTKAQNTGIPKPLTPTAKTTNGGHSSSYGRDNGNFVLSIYYYNIAV